MAKAMVRYAKGDESVTCVVTTKAEHPDALDMITLRARQLHLEVMADRAAAEVVEDVDPLG